MKKLKPISIAALDVKLKNTDIGYDITIRDYFFELFSLLWREREGFNSKRPFGNSCWQYVVLNALVIEGYIEGSIEHYEDEITVDISDEQLDQADKFLQDLIKLAFYGEQKEV